VVSVLSFAVAVLLGLGELRYFVHFELGKELPLTSGSSSMISYGGSLPKLVLGFTPLILEMPAIQTRFAGRNDSPVPCLLVVDFTRTRVMRHDPFQQDFICPLFKFSSFRS
jgi:hypothetical protein